MMNTSLPRSIQKGINIHFNTNEELRETTNFLASEFPISIYIQNFKENTQDYIPFHWHEEFQLTWIVEGNLEYTLNGQTVQLQSNQLLLINSHQLHSSRTLQVNSDTLCFNFSPHIFSEYIKKSFILPLTKNTSFTYAVLPIQPQQLNLLKKCLNLEENPQLHFSIFNFLSMLMEEAITISIKNTEIVNRKELDQFYTMIEYIHQNYYSQLTVVNIAKQVLTNKNRCTSLFKKYAKTSPMKYVTSYRLHVAKDLLLHTDYSISEIALAVGFNQLSYFIEQFRKNYGLSPLKYRYKFSIS